MRIEGAGAALVPRSCCQVTSVVTGMVLWKTTMNPRFDPVAPTGMTAEERLAEVAALLAEGVLRLRRRGTLATEGEPLKSLESGGKGLEVLEETGLHGVRG